MKKDKPLAKPEIRKAALMYNIITLCQLNGDSETDEQHSVKDEATEQAWALWYKHFPDIKNMPLSFQGCIDAIKGMRK